MQLYLGLNVVMPDTLWTVLTQTMTWKIFIRLIGLTFWKKEELKYKCFKIKKVSKNRELRSLYEKEKYEAIRGTISIFN